MDIVYGRAILGNVFFGRICGHINREYPFSLESFKVVQTKLDEFTFYIVKGIGFKDFVISIILDMIRSEIGKEIKVDFIFLDQIDLSANGKKKVFEVNIS
jgi:hypothetical protein